MLNSQKYQTAEERSRALIAFCHENDCRTCPARADNADCRFVWLDLDPEVVKPLPCPFCGGNVSYRERRGEVWYHCDNAKCGYVSGEKPTEAAAVAAHNRVAKAVMDSKKEGETDGSK